jgi:hypothetical protein
MLWLLVVVYRLVHFGLAVHMNPLVLFPGIWVDPPGLTPTGVRHSRIGGLYDQSAKWGVQRAMGAVQGPIGAVHVEDLVRVVHMQNSMRTEGLYMEQELADTVHKRELDPDLHTDTDDLVGVDHVDDSGEPLLVLELVLGFVLDLQLDLHPDLHFDLHLDPMVERAQAAEVHSIPCNPNEDSLPTPNHVFQGYSFWVHLERLAILYLWYPSRLCWKSAPKIERSG